MKENDFFLTVLELTLRLELTPTHTHTNIRIWKKEMCSDASQIKRSEAKRDRGGQERVEETPALWPPCSEKNLHLLHGCSPSF